MWQIFVIIYASFKYYVLSCEMQTSVFYEQVQRDTTGLETWHDFYVEITLPYQATYVFAMLFFGNLIDNHN